MNLTVVRIIVLLTFALSILSLPGCLSQSKEQVIVFSALDREFSKPVFDRLQQETNIQILAKYDTESTKTVGLANQILQAEEPAACDLFWNNELLHTLRLENAGKLDSLPPEVLEQFPPGLQSSSGKWVGLAARGRVIIYNRQLTGGKQLPTTIEDLVDPQWKGKCCIAKPLFGTTATHFAILYQDWGAEKFGQFVEQLKENEVGILSGNRQGAADVGAGKYLFGFTDTDDYEVERLAGSPVGLIWPEQQETQTGAILLPNTICVPKNAAHRQNALVLLQRIVDGRIEQDLASGPSIQLPLRKGLEDAAPDLFRDPTPKWHSIQWSQTVEAWEQSSEILKQAFY